MSQSPCAQQARDAAPGPGEDQQSHQQLSDRRNSITKGASRISTPKHCTFLIPSITNSIFPGINSSTR
eukprot:7062019-Pyramimonas_sp.AAC.1